MKKGKNDKAIKILWAVCVIPLIIGLIVLCTQVKTETYSTDEYWVAQDYHHVYERSSGEIVDKIEKNETCKIKGKEIIVEKRGKAYTASLVISVIFGMLTIGCIVGEISTSDWWNNLIYRRK